MREISSPSYFQVRRYDLTKFKSSQYCEDKKQYTKKDGIITVSEMSSDLRGYIVACIALLISIVLTLDFFLSFKQPIIGILFIFVVIALGIYVLWDLIKPDYYHLNRFEWSLIETAYNIICHNKLVVRNQDGIITSSVMVQIRIEGNNVIMNFFADGNHFSDNIQHLETQIQSAVNRDVFNKKIYPDCTAYYFHIYPERRLTVTKSLMYQGDSIFLTPNISIDFNKTPHALIAGVTGSGKSYLTAYILSWMYCHGAHISICDPKNSELATMGQMINSIDVAMTKGQIARLLKDAVTEMEDRNQKMTQMRNEDNFSDTYHDYGFKPMLIVIDEVAALRASMDSKEDKDFISLLKQLVLKGRSAGVFILLATQQPNAQSSIPTDIRDQMSVRIALGTMSPEGYRMTLGPQDCDYKTCGSGEGYVYMATQDYGSPQYFKTPRITNLYDLVKIMKDYGDSY